MHETDRTQAMFRLMAHLVFCGVYYYFTQAGMPPWYLWGLFGVSCIGALWNVFRLANG